MDQTEAEDFEKRQQEYTEELYKQDLHNPDNHDGVIIHLEPDILECKVKWALASIATNQAIGGDGMPVELFQILKDEKPMIPPNFLYCTYTLDHIHCCSVRLAPGQHL